MSNTKKKIYGGLSFKSVDGRGNSDFVLSDNGRPSILRDGNLKEIVTDIPYVAYLKDVKVSGQGGGSSSTTPIPRDINTVEGDGQSVGVTINSTNNGFIVGPGTFEIEWSAPVFNSDRHQSAIYNNDTQTYVAMGTCEFSSSQRDDTQSKSKGFVKLVLNEATEFSIHHQVESVSNNTGFGIPCGGVLSMSTEEVYTTIKITKMPV